MGLRGGLYLAHVACMPRRLYVLLSLISFFSNEPLSKENSVSTGPIFTKFSPYGRYLIVDCRFGLLFSDGSRDVAMATNFSVKIRLFTFIRSPGIPKWIAISLKKVPLV